MKVLVVGAGWAGLAAAVELANRGLHVTVVEAAREAGGRARSISFDGRRVDNGQHVMIGAYRDLLYLLRVLGVDPDAAFIRRRLYWHLRSTTRHETRLRVWPLPAPLHLAAGLLGARGIPLRDRWRTANAIRALLADAATPEPDISVRAWLAGYRLPKPALRMLFDPLCLATMNLPVAEASAEVFLQVLRQAFGGARSDSDLLFARAHLGATVPEPALRFIRERGGDVVLGRRVTGLRIEADRMLGVRLDDAELDANEVILAVPHTMAARLLAPHAPLRASADRLATLDTRPICTVYLQFPAACRLPQPMLGMLDTTAQWIFDRRFQGQPGLLAAVISGAGAHMTLHNDALVRQVTKELRHLFPRWPHPEASLVVREKRATFAALPGVNRLRPQVQTAVRGCWLAGDYTATGLPATLESAVRSGLECARRLTDPRTNASNAG